MKRLRINHITIYTYSGPVKFGRHRMVLRPREGHDLHVEEMKLAIEPTARVIWTRDVFGNSVALADFVEPADTLRIESNVLLRHTTEPRPGPQVPWTISYPVVYDPLESVVAAAYRATSHSDDEGSVREFLREHDLLTASNAATLVELVNSTVHKRIRYQRRPEKGVQTPAATIEKSSGSCRDMATLMMECCRSLGIAARFASGYLDCPASEAGRASTHAWVEAYFPTLGWIAYDPTLGEHASHKHIPCGLSNHPRGVMPVSGTFNREEDSQFLEMTVAVKIEKMG